MRVPEHRPRMYKGGKCQFTRPPCLSQNLLHRIQAKKIGKRVFRKEIPLKKKVNNSLGQKMEMMKVIEMRKGRVKRKKNRKKKKGRTKRMKYASLGSKKEDHVRRALVVRPRVPHQGTTCKALPPSEGDRAFALKMADEVLKHLIFIGASRLSGTPTSGATQSQCPSNPGDDVSSRRKGKEPATSQRLPKKFKS
ncbi:hypothetical protein Scep_006749 [Stephania cephalantha]|uniref:Uncharacterized protein n=1 Tax=Stephania cephalantha TaxID=152367 RepID=A0AAP0KB30_9MAGN